MWLPPRRARWKATMIQHPIRTLSNSRASRQASFLHRMLPLRACQPVSCMHPPHRSSPIPHRMPSSEHAIRLVRMVATSGHQMRNVQEPARHRVCSVVATLVTRTPIQIRFHLDKPSGKPIREFFGSGCQMQLPPRRARWHATITSHPIHIPSNGLFNGIRLQIFLKACDYVFEILSSASRQRIYQFRLCWTRKQRCRNIFVC